MPDMAVNMVVQTRIEWECLGQRDLTVWHWNVEQVDAGTEMFNWLRNAHNANLLLAGRVIDQLVTVMSNQCKCTGVVGQVVHPTRYHGVRTETSRDGLDMSPVGTNNLALSIGYAPVLAGRGRTGRTQVPGLPKKWVVDGRWDLAVVAPVYAALVPFRVEPWTMAMGGAKLRPILFAPAAGFKNPIIDATFYTTVRTMHRRTLGVGQ